MELCKFLVDFGFTQSHQDYSIFFHCNRCKYTVIVAYVDDLLVTGNDPDFISDVKQALHSAFTIKYLGKIKYFSWD